MIHYSCDMCGSIIKTEEELRYVVKIEIYPADDDEEENEELGSIGDDIAGFDLEDEKGLEEKRLELEKELNRITDEVDLMVKNLNVSII